MRDLVSDMERRHSHRNAEDLPEPDGEKISAATRRRFQRVGRYYDSRLNTNDRYSLAVAGWPGFLRQQPWSQRQREIVSRLLKERMADTGESAEDAAKEILKQFKDKREAW